ncbi:unnamed protein product [Caenorhabditis brenneri]
MVNNKLDTTIPTPLSALHDCWWSRSSTRQQQFRKPQHLGNLRAAIKYRMKSPERLEEFTNVQKAQLLFILSLEVNSNFENILKNEGHLIELTDPDRRISFFRSNDGTIERRGVHPPERSRNNRANLQPDHEDYNGAQDDELAEHVKLNQQVKRHCRQNLELNQVEEEQGNLVQQRLCAQLISDHRRIKRARIESNQQLLQKNIRAQMGLHPRNQSVPAQRIRVLVPKAAPSTAVMQAVTSQLKTAPVPVEVPAPAKNRVPATATSVNQSVPTRRILVFVPKAASSTAVRQVVAPQVNSAPVPVEVPAPAKNRVPASPRRISFFRSNDGAIERRGVHQPARSRNNRANLQQDNEENNGARDDELAEEDEQEEMDVGPQNYDDPMVSDDQKDQQLALVIAEEFSRGNEHEHVKLNDQKERNRRQSLEFNQENAEEEKGDVIQQRPCAHQMSDRCGIKRARKSESNQQPLQEDIGAQIGPLPRIDNHRIPQLHPVGQVPAATAVNQSEPARTIPVLVPAAAPSTAVSQAVAPRVNPAPVPVEVPAPAKNRAPALPRPTYPAPTVSIFLRNLHASYESLRIPVLNGVIETIKKEMKKHQNNTNPVSINYVVASIPTIVHYANQGDPADENEETISQRRFVEILSQSLVLLNSPEFDTVLATLKEKKYTLNYENKICVKYVKMSVDIFLGAVGDESEKMEVDSPRPQEMKYDVLISLYASVTNLKYISRSSTTFGLIIQAISTHKNDKKPISLKNFETFLKAAILLGETKQNVRKFVINRRVYMETIYHILHIIGSEHVQKLMEELDKTMENLSYDTKISFNDVNLGLGLLLKAITT